MAHFNSYCQPDKTRSGPSSRPLLPSPTPGNILGVQRGTKHFGRTPSHLAGHSFYGFATSALHDADDNAEFASGLKDLILSKPNETARLTLRPHDMLTPLCILTPNEVSENNEVTRARVHALCSKRSS